jgi:hypothetical protein
MIVCKHKQLQTCTQMEIATPNIGVCPGSCMLTACCLYIQSLIYSAHNKTPSHCTLMFHVSHINKTHSKHFSEHPKTSGGHSKKLPPVIYTIHHTVLDLEQLIQLFKWLKCLQM